MAKRSRVTVGKLVASTNPLRKILAKRLDMRVLYTTNGFSHKIISERAVGVAVTT